MNSNRYQNYLLFVLAAILASNYLENFALGLLLQSIKVDLKLTDTELGLLNGLGYAFFYAIMGIPLARWADRGNRVYIIGFTTALWSAAVTLCALATTFLQLLIIRIGVAVGEAGCIPPAHSLIADCFPRSKRPWAVSRYMLGAPLSVIIGYMVAGWLNEMYGWRATLVMLSLPGLGLAALAYFTLKEPRLGTPPPESGERTEGKEVKPTLRDVFATLWHTPSLRHLLFFYSIVYFFGFGIQRWQPTFFVRSFHLGTAELGTWLSLVFGLGGLIGTVLGGSLAQRYATDKESIQMKFMAVIYSAIGVVSALPYLTTSRFVALAFLSVAAVGGAMTIGPLFAAIQTLVPQNMRATSIAVIYLFANLVGMGLGPLLAGSLSDVLHPMFGEESLRYALLLLCPGYFWGGWHLWLASKHVRNDLSSRKTLEKTLRGSLETPMSAHF